MKQVVLQIQFHYGPKLVSLCRIFNGLWVISLNLACYLKLRFKSGVLNGQSVCVYGVRLEPVVASLTSEGGLK
jgi:hypothetical protein